MTQPVNPNTDLPMSLRLERIQQIKQLQAGHEQGQLAQQIEEEKHSRQQRVNKKDEAEQVRIREEGQKHREDGRDGRQDDGTEEDREKGQLRKGKFIDVKV